MLATVLIFAALTALFEAILLFEFGSERWLRRLWVRNSIHILAIAVNFTIHWGTIVGTMTAVTAGLVSFATVPAVRYLMAYRRRIKETA